MRRGVYKLFFVVIFVVFVSSLNAQNLGVLLDQTIERYFEANYERIYELYINSLNDDAEFDDNLMNDYREYDDNIKSIIKNRFSQNLKSVADKQLNINDLTYRKLRDLNILTHYQINSFLGYKERCGIVVSYFELSQIAGFNADLAYLFSLLFIFPNDEVNDEYIHKLNESLMVKPLDIKSSVIYSPQKYLRFRGQSKITFKDRSNIFCGFFLENDAGEGGRYFWRLWDGEGRRMVAENIDSNMRIPVIDFSSFNIGVSDMRISKKIVLKTVIGDYKACFGQGLVINSSRIFGSASQPIGFIINNDDIRPYGSADENSHLRGVAASIFHSNCNLSMNLFYSDKKIDARVNDGKYSSIIKDGVHNSVRLLQTRKTMSESLYGVNINKQWWQLKIGCSAILYRYGLENGRKQTYYNKYQLFNGYHYNFGINWRYSSGRSLFFGEIAKDSLSFAAIAGFFYRLEGDLELLISARHYGIKYINPFANAYSTISSVSNQQGVVLSMYKPVSNDVKFSLFADYTLYPYSRYGIKNRSVSGKIKLGFENRVDDYGFYWRVKCSYNMQSYRDDDSVRLFDYKLGLKLFFEERMRSFNISVTAENALKSYYIKLAGEYYTMNRVLSIKGGGFYYNVRSWKERLFAYEAIIPEVYSGRLLYKKGFAGYGYLMAKPYRNLKIYLKYSAPNSYVVSGLILNV